MWPDLLFLLVQSHPFIHFRMFYLGIETPLFCQSVWFLFFLKGFSFVLPGHGNVFDKWPAESRYIYLSIYLHIVVSGMASRSHMCHRQVSSALLSHSALHVPRMLSLCNFCYCSFVVGFLVHWFYFAIVLLGGGLKGYSQLSAVRRHSQGNLGSNYWQY